LSALVVFVLPEGFFELVLEDDDPAGGLQRGALLDHFAGPSGKTQLTVNGLPVYVYEHDAPNVVLCDDVDGWFAIRQR